MSGAALRMGGILILLTLVLPAVGQGQIGDPYAEALRYYNLGRYSRAQERLERMLEIDRQCIECYELLARIATAGKQDSLATDWYRQALRVEPEHPGLLLQLGLAQQRVGKLDSALASIGRALMLNPTSGEAHFSLGNIWFDLDSLAQAEASYGQAMFLDSAVAKVHFQMGGVYLRTMRPDSALAEFREAYILYPKYAMAYEESAAILRRQGRWPEMVAVLERGLAQASETRNTRYWLGSAYIEVRAYDRAAEILGGFVVRNREHLGARFKYGVALHGIGEYQLATEHLELVTQRLPNLIEGRLYLGMAFAALDRDSLALAAFDTLLMTDPGYYAAWIQKGDLHLKRRRYAEAGALYRQAAQLAPGRWGAYHRQGRLHYLQIAYLEAELLLFQALIRNDTVSAVHNALGDVAAALGEDDFAAYYYGKVLAADPEDDEARYDLVDALTRRKLYRTARRELGWLLDRDKDSESLLYRMGLLSSAARDTLAADRYLERYAEIHQARRRLEQLKFKISLAPRNPSHYRNLGQYYLVIGANRLAREAFRQAVALGDTSLSASDYMEEGVGP